MRLRINVNLLNKARLLNVLASGYDVQVTRSNITIVKESALNYIVYHSFDLSICIYKHTNTTPSGVSSLNSSIYWKQYFQFTPNQLEDASTDLTPYQRLISEQELNVSNVTD
jgi:hypothetical protein